MRFLIPHWPMLHIGEIIRILREQGHTVIALPDLPRSFHYDPVFRRRFTDITAQETIQAVFSLQYFPILSDLCEKSSLPYICWCFRHPLNTLLLTKSLANSCNLLFLADRELAGRLTRLGADSVYYLPWGVAPRSCSPRDDTACQDVCLMDASDPEAWLQYLTLYSRLDDRTKGFLDGLLDAQQRLPHSHFLTDALPPALLPALRQALPLSSLRNSIVPQEERYARELLVPALYRKSMDGLLRILDRSGQESTALYTSSRRSGLRHITQYDLPSDVTQEREIYTRSRIHVLPAPWEEGSAMPVHALEAMGCGELLLAHFPMGTPEGFQAGRDYIPYQTPEELPGLIKYYLSHPQQRRQVGDNARKNIVENHNLALRIREMLNTLRL